MKCCRSPFLLLWRAMKRDKCVFVCGGREDGGEQERTREAEINIFFTESPGVAGTEMGRNGGGDDNWSWEAGQGKKSPRGRRDWRKEGSRKSYFSCLFICLFILLVISQLPEIDCTDVCMGCRGCRLLLWGVYTSKRSPQQTENMAALISYTI